MSKSYKNKPENNLMQLAVSNGWRVTKRGWPDFLCHNPITGECIAIEVKPRTAQGKLTRLKDSQATCMDLLSSKGIRCFVSDGQTLERYERTKHRKVADSRSRHCTP